MKFKVTRDKVDDIDANFWQDVCWNCGFIMRGSIYGEEL